MSLFKHFVGISQHKLWVTTYATQFATQLVARSLVHDLSKFWPDEALGFSRLTKILSTEKYGSEKYKKALKSPCIQQHYKRNSHHPEYHSRGVRDMTLLEVTEMWCDWKASLRRVLKGDLKKSLQQNQNRFDGQDQTSIFEMLGNELGIPFEKQRTHESLAIAAVRVLLDGLRLEVLREISEEPQRESLIGRTLFRLGLVKANIEEPFQERSPEYTISDFGKAVLGSAALGEITPKQRQICLEETQKGHFDVDNMSERERLDHVNFLWDSYVMEKDSRLAEDAKQLKYRILNADK